MTRVSTFRATGLAVALALGLLAACGAGAPPSLPPESPTPWTARLAPAPATPALLADRRLGTTGHACVDCHRLGAAEASVRPGPDLAGLAGRRVLWSGSTTSPAVAANLCVERWLARPSLDGPRLGGLLAALEALPVSVPAAVAAPASPPSTTAPAAPPPATDAAALAALPEGDAARGAAAYDAACRHCHEGGPAGPLWGRPWARGGLLLTIRGFDRARHPGTLMPPFEAGALPDAALADLATALADAAEP